MGTDGFKIDNVLDAVERKSGRKYRIIKHLGGGEFSNVHLVRLESTGEEHALKILDYHFLLQKLKKEDLSDSKRKFNEIKKRFLFEASLYEKIDHPNIVKIRDSGVVAHKREGIEIPYFIMNYVKGSSLSDIIKNESPLDIDRVKRISRDVLHALEVIHQNNIIHRDLKPANIMIEEATGNAVLIDFGIAKDVVKGTKLTTTGSLLGSPIYMAPEQFIDSSKVGPRIDIYSYGVVLYEMLMGEPPFKGGNFLEIMNAHRERPVPSVREKHPHLPPWIDYILSRAMAKSPQDRYKDAGALLNALETGREDKPRGHYIKYFVYLIIPVIVLGIAAFLIFGPRGPDEIPKGNKTESGEEVSSQGDTSLKKYDGIIAAARDCYRRGDYKEAKIRLDEAAKIKNGDEIKELSDLIRGKEMELMKEDYSELIKFLETPTEDKIKAEKCRAFLETYQHLPRDEQTAPMFSEIEAKADQFESEVRYWELIASIDTFLKNNQFDKAEEALAEARKIKDTEELKLLAEKIAKQKAENESINGSEVFKTIRQSLDLNKYLAFKKKFPSSNLLPELKGELLKVEANLPPEKYWDKNLIKNKRGFYELAFGNEHNGHLMIYIPRKKIWIDKYEVSNAQFKRFSEGAGVQFVLKSDSQYINSGDTYPAVVKYADAEKYCNAYGLRLPRIDEWEYAAGREQYIYPWGNEAPDADGVWRANYDTLADTEKDGYSGTAPVDSFAKFSSPCDAVNMAGNVWEWVQGRILKGGGFFSDKEDLKIMNSSGKGDNAVEGFRCVKDEL